MGEGQQDVSGPERGPFVAGIVLRVMGIGFVLIGVLPLVGLVVFASAWGGGGFESIGSILGYLGINFGVVAACFGMAELANVFGKYLSGRLVIFSRRGWWLRCGLGIARRLVYIIGAAAILTFVQLGIDGWNGAYIWAGVGLVLLVLGFCGFQWLFRRAGRGQWRER